MRLNILVTAFALALAQLPGQAAACAITHVLTPDSAAGADFVLSGRVIDYAPNAWDSFPAEPRYARVRVEVDKVWKGAPGKVFEFVLRSDDALMHGWAPGADIILAAYDPGKPGAHPRESLPQVMERICTMEIIVATSENLALFDAGFPD